MNTLTRRSPGLYDCGDWTLSLGGEYRCNGSHRPFRVTLTHRITVPHGGSGLNADGTHCDGLIYKDRSLTIPKIKFMTAFRLGRVGMFFYKIQARVLHKLATI